LITNQPHKLKVGTILFDFKESRKDEFQVHKVTKGGTSLLHHHKFVKTKQIFVYWEGSVEVQSDKWFKEEFEKQKFFILK